MSDTTDLKRQLVRAAKLELARRAADRENRKTLEESLAAFHKAAWGVIDPAPYLHNWHIDAIAEHLEAVNDGDITRLIITMPPRFSKSLLVSVSWPAFTWAQSQYGALSGAHVKFVNISYDPDLSIRDAIKMRRLLKSNWYRERWKDRYEMMRDKDRAEMFENSAGGFRFSTSVSGGLTGEGGDVIVVDDALNANKANWESARKHVNDWWDESVPTRLNDPSTGAKIVVQQRLHEDDLVGHILDKQEENWTVLNLPMEFDPALDTKSFVWIDGEDGELLQTEFFTDPREEEGDLLWEARFPRVAVDRLKIELGPFAAAAQLQQTPVPKGGGIIDRLWWRLWPPDEREKDFQGSSYNPNRFPPCVLIVGSIDTAYGEKDTDAWNAMTTWGVWMNSRERPQTILMEAWRWRGPLRGVYPEDAVTEDERKPYWGLAERVADTCQRRQIDILLIENKTRAKDLEAELRRLIRVGQTQVILLNPLGDKVARLHSTQPVFSDGMVWAPSKVWAETVITEVSQFPRSKWKDYTDTVSQALSWMRNEGVLQLGTEADADNLARDTFHAKRELPYDV